MQNKKNYSAAFTLIEVLIAMIVLAIILLFLYFIFRTTLRAGGAAQKSAVPFKEANLIYSELNRKMLEFNYLYPVFIGTYEKEDGVILPTVYFSGLSKTPVPFSAKVSNENMNYFYLKRQKRKKAKKAKNAKKVYELMYLQSFYRTGRDGALKVSMDKILVAKNLAYMKILYYENGLWLKKYDYAQYNSAPQAVRIKFGIFNAGSVKKFDLTFNMFGKSIA